MNRRYPTLLARPRPTCSPGPASGQAAPCPISRRSRVQARAPCLARARAPSFLTTLRRRGGSPAPPCPVMRRTIPPPAPPGARRAPAAVRGRTDPSDSRRRRCGRWTRARRACGDNGWPTRGKASVEWPAAATAALSQIDPPRRLAGYEEKRERYPVKSKESV
jgi:hypothetical protein